MLSSRSFRHFFRRATALLCLLASLSVCGVSFAQALGTSRAPLAGTPITNQAELRFRDGGSDLPVRIVTNTVRALVSAVPGLELLEDRSVRALPGSAISLPHTLRNTGNVRTG